MNYRREDIDRLLGFLGPAELQRVAEKSGMVPTCLGGPIDGMLAAVATSCFKVAGPSMLVPSLLVLTSPTEAPVKLEHRYARDNRGAYVYVGFVRVEQC